MLYLLEFDKPIGGRARYYLGYCKNDLNKRIKAHVHGTGRARLTEVAKERNIGFKVVYVWPDLTRADERKFKKRKNHGRLLARALKTETPDVSSKRRRICNNANRQIQKYGGGT